MAIPKEALVYVSRLSKEEKAGLFSAREISALLQSDGGGGSDMISAFRLCLNDVVLDRLVLAHSFLEMARTLFRVATEAAFRTSIGRAYYSIHHSIRVMVLSQTEFESDGHDEAIQMLKELLKDNAFKAKSGLPPDICANVYVAKDNRHVADYSPYEISRGANNIAHLHITDSDWQKAAAFNIKLAELLDSAAAKVVGL